MPDADASVDPELLSAVRRLKLQVGSAALGLKKMTKELASGMLPPEVEVTTKSVRMALAVLEAEATDALTEASGVPTHAFEAKMHATEGYNLHATRTIEAGDLILEELPLIRTTKAASHSDRTEQCLKAFCTASSAIKASVLEMFSPLGEIELSDEIAMRLARVDVHARKGWARGEQLNVLKKAQLAFELNTHEIDGAEAIFELSAKINHSCDPNANYCISEGKLRHMAVRRISAGEAITSNYIGDHIIMDHSRRQRRLHTEKLFHCACSRCTKPDLSRVVPCPGCHPRDWSGRLPEEPPSPPQSVAKAAAEDDRRIAYATPIATPPASTGPMWRCERCDKSWYYGEISQGVRPDALRAMPDSCRSLDPRILDEEKMSDAVYNFTDQVLNGGRGLSYPDVASLVYATSRLLGRRHWATAQAFSMRCSVLGPHMTGSPAAASALSSIGLSAPEAVYEFVEGCQVCWNFCAHSMQPASVCGDAFVGSGVVALLLAHAETRTSPGTSRQPNPAAAVDAATMADLRLRALVCLSTLTSKSYFGCAAARDALERDGVPCDGKPAAGVLRERAEVALRAGEVQDAVMYYRGAVMCDPKEESTHASLAACMLQCASG